MRLSNDIRVQLEGDAERLESAIAAYDDLRVELESPRWLEWLRPNDPRPAQLADSEEAWLDTLWRARKHASAHGEPAHSAVEQLSCDFFRARGLLQNALARRLCVRSDAELVAMLRKLELAAAPVSVERVLASHVQRQPPRWISVLAGVALVAAAILGFKLLTWVERGERLGPAPAFRVPSPAVLPARSISW